MLQSQLYPLLTSTTGLYHAEYVKHSSHTDGEGLIFKGFFLIIFINNNKLYLFSLLNTVMFLPLLNSSEEDIALRYVYI